VVESVRYERRGAAVVLTIDRPERRNAVDGPTAEALRAAYERWVADDEARVLVLTGAGDVAFCAGADLKALETFAPRLAARGGPLGFTRLTPPKPTIAAISQETMLADRRAAIEGFGLPLEAALAVEARAGMETFEVALRGARRFAGGEGRGGTGAGV